MAYDLSVTVHPGLRPRHATPTDTGRGGKRADIQGLRALAVTLVIVFHFFPTLVPGGFVGVDVFFVISGYLITLLLVREIERTGTISLSQFYARRVRRLMPAAVTTTLVTVVAASVVVGPVTLVSILRDAAWTSAYLANVRFGMNPAGYFATSEPSPFLHFWSLAVEEQYYVLWPALLLLTVLLVRGRTLAVLPYILAVVVGVSVALSVAWTSAGSSHAYYSLATRAWELGIGGGLALVVARRAAGPGPRAAAGMATLGLAAVLFAALTFSGTTPFPGWQAAVPTVGTALVIWAGTSRRTYLDRVWNLPILRSVGDSSYSLYLWHWPVLILGTTVLGETVGARLLLCALTVALGALSFVVIEIRVGQASRRWTARRTLSVAAAVSAVAILVPAVIAPLVPITGGSEVASSGPVILTASVEDRRIVVTPAPPLQVPQSVPANVSPALDRLSDDVAGVFRQPCYSGGVCEGGDPNGAVRVVLAGDSHAGQWWPALDAAAKAAGWKAFLVGKNGCALADLPISLETTSEAWPDCSTWQADATAMVVDLAPDLVLYANDTLRYSMKESVRDGFPGNWEQGVDRTLGRFAEVAPVVVFGQSPELGTDPATCLSEHLADVAACSVDVEVASPPQIRTVVEATADRNDLLYFDPTELLCDEHCAVMDSNTVMYRDHSHLSSTYSLLLAGTVESIVATALEYHG